MAIYEYSAYKAFSTVLLFSGESYVDVVPPDNIDEEVDDGTFVIDEGLDAPVTITVEVTIGNLVEVEATDLQYIGQVDVNGVSSPVFNAVFQVDLGGIIGVTAGSTTVVFSSETGEGNFPATEAELSSNLVADPLEICFAAGTLIATPDGEKEVQTLNVGDLVLSPDGRSMPVKWIGKQTISTLFAAPEKRMLVRVRAGALGAELPHSDLSLTADHAIFLGGILCNASTLVNGSTIEYIPKTELGESYVVYHVETDDHALIRANGVVTETFIDAVPRDQFDNYEKYVAVYGSQPAPMRMLPYPRALSKRQLPTEVRSLAETPQAA